MLSFETRGLCVCGVLFACTAHAYGTIVTPMAPTQQERWHKSYCSEATSEQASCTIV